MERHATTAGKRESCIYCNNAIALTGIFFMGDWFCRDECYEKYILRKWCATIEDERIAPVA